MENFLIKEGVGDMLRALHVDPMLQRTRLAIVFSSPELKAQVSFSDRFLSVVRLSVCRLSVCL